jgi:hypothetical protein
VRFLLVLTITACGPNDPASQVEGQFTGSINDDCRCDVDNNLEFQVTCGGDDSPSFFVDAPTPGMTVTANVLVLYSYADDEHSYAGAAAVTAMYPGGEQSYDGYDVKFRPFEVASASAPDGMVCDPIDSTVCRMIHAWSITSGKFTCEEPPY